MTRVRLTGSQWDAHRGSEVEADSSYADNLLEITSDDEQLDGAIVVLPDYIPLFPGDLSHESWGAELLD